jgi:hypothetical protein
MTVNLRQLVARIERSEIRGGAIRKGRFPDFAPLNPGYGQ